jgi:hypothetical protein
MTIVWTFYLRRPLMKRRGSRNRFMLKRIFASFAIEDANLRKMLIGHARNEKSPCEFAATV